MADRKKQKKTMVKKEVEPGRSAEYIKERDDILREVARLNAENPKYSLLWLYPSSDPELSMHNFVSPSTPGLVFLQGVTGPADPDKYGSSFGLWVEDGEVLELDSQEKLEYAKERVRKVGAPHNDNAQPKN